MTSAIQLTQVSVVRSDSLLLDRVDWTVREGERWIVLGPNGAGKTTLMQIASATTFPSQGRATVLGQELGTVNLFELRTRIGHTSLTVADRLPPTESVRDAVLSAAHGVTGRWREEYDEADTAQADQIIGELGIAHLAGRTFGTLSEGRKRVLIARALMTDPEMIVLDEPAAGLDLGAREDLVSSLQNLASDDDAPVLVLVTHHVEEIPPGFTHVLLLRDGAVVAQGPISSTLTAENLTRAFGTPLELAVSEGRYTARRVRYGRRAARPEE